MKTFFKILLLTIGILASLQTGQAQVGMIWDQPKKVSIELLTSTSGQLVVQFDAATLTDTITLPLSGTRLVMRPGRALLSVCYQVALDSSFRQTVVHNGSIKNNGDLSCISSNALLIRDRPLPPPNVHIDSALLVRFSVMGLRPNTTYWVRSRAWSARIVWDYFLDSFYSDTVRFTTPLGVSVREPEQSTTLELAPPYPNPCGEETTVRCVLPEAQMLTLCLYDAFGRQVMTVAEGQHGKGAHVFRLITKALPAGVYHLRLQTPDAVMVQNLVHF
jgi:hypothetical protein